MAELGGGNGTSFPGGIDTDTTQESTSTVASPNVPNDLGAAIVAIETELGTDPAGTLTNVKTFLQTQHNTDGTHKSITTAETITTTIATGTSPLTVSSATVCTNLNAEQHNGLKNKVINIGDWNMDTTASVNVAHGLTLANIRSVSVTIRNDTNANYYTFEGAGVGISGQGNWHSADATNVVINRLTTGDFDSTDFDSTTYNRGWITIWYV